MRKSTAIRKILYRHCTRQKLFPQHRRKNTPLKLLWTLEFYTRAQWNRKRFKTIERERERYTTWKSFTFKLLIDCCNFLRETCDILPFGWMANSNARRWRITREEWDEEWDRYWMEIVEMLISIFVFDSLEPDLRCCCLNLNLMPSLFKSIKLSTEISLLCHTLRIH